MTDKNAGFLIRGLASLTGSLLWQLVVTGTFVYLTLQDDWSTPTAIAKAVVLLLIATILLPIGKFLVNPFLISKFGGDVGKLLWGLAIVKEDDLHLTFKGALFREYVAKIASKGSMGLGYLWIFKDAEKRAWHDLLSGTHVVRKNEALFFAGTTVLLASLVLNSIFLFVGVKNITPKLSSITKDVELKNIMNTNLQQAPETTESAD